MTLTHTHISFHTACSKLESFQQIPEKVYIRSVTCLHDQLTMACCCAHLFLYKVDVYMYIQLSKSVYIPYKFFTVYLRRYVTKNKTAPSHNSLHLANCL